MASDSKAKKAKAPRTVTWPERGHPDLLPTLGKDIHARLLAIWEESRRVCTGYGKSIGKDGKKKSYIKAASPWFKESDVGTKTSCSPWTFTVSAMLLDPACADKGSIKEKVKNTVFFPKCNAGREPWPRRVFCLYQGDGYKASNGRAPACFDHTCGAAVYLNIAYEISPEDARRGDLINYDPGHTGFVWDVHLTGDPEHPDPKHDKVDCFQIIGANGSYKKAALGSGDGVAISTSGHQFLTPSDETGFKKAEPDKDYCVDHPKFVHHGNFNIVDNADKMGISGKTFRFPLVPGAISAHAHNQRCARFWGVAPPERWSSPDLDAKSVQFRTYYQDQIKRIKEAKGEDGKPLYPGFDEKKFEAPPKPYAWAKLEPYPYEDASARHTSKRAGVQAKARPPTKKIPKDEVKKDPEAAKKSVPTPKVQQAKEQVLPHQYELEDALALLFLADWIDKSPGDVTRPGDTSTKEAIQAFQKQWKIEPANGVCDAKTRAEIFRARDDLVAKKKNPHAPAPAKKGSPAISSFFPDDNHVIVGQKARFIVTGKELRGASRVTLRLTGSGGKPTLDLPSVAPIFSSGTDGHNLDVSVALPAEARVHTTWVPSVEVEVDGATLRFESKVKLEIVDAPPDKKIGQVGGWNYDLRTWPKLMRAVYEELRQAKPPKTDMKVFAFSKYYVKEVSLAEPSAKKDDSGHPVVVPMLDLHGEPIKLGERVAYASRGRLAQASTEGDFRLVPSSRLFKFTTQKSSVKKTIPAHSYKKGTIEEQVLTYHPGTGFPPSRPIDGWRPAYYYFEDLIRIEEIDNVQFPWGKGAGGVPLSKIPLRTLAMNCSAKAGLKSKWLWHIAYIAELDGTDDPVSGGKHNGMVIIADAGGMCTGVAHKVKKGKSETIARDPSTGAALPGVSVAEGHFDFFEGYEKAAGPDGYPWKRSNLGESIWERKGGDRKAYWNAHIEILGVSAAVEAWRAEQASAKASGKSNKSKKKKSEG